MGMGKTLQAIGVMLALVRFGVCQRILVLAPASLVDNWRDEVAKWVGSSPLVSSAIDIQSYDKFRVHGSGGLVIDAVVLDEAHTLKNPSSSRTNAVADGDRAILHHGGRRSTYAPT